MISKPSNLFLIFSLFIVFLLLFPIYEVNYEFSAFSYIFLFFCFFSAYAGLFLGEIILSLKILTMIIKMKNTMLISYLM